MLAAAVMGPLLKSGYILSLDMPFGPNESYTAYFYGFPNWLGASASAPLSLFFPVLSHFVPVWLLEKLILFSLLFLTGLGAHKLISHAGWGSYFAGILYMINPFTYVRFASGQWGILWNYAFFPFAVKAFLDLLEQRTMKNLLLVVLFSTLVGIAQLHGLFLLFIILLILFITRIIKESDRQPKMNICKFVLLACAMFLTLNIYWILPVFSGEANYLNQLGDASFNYFAAQGTSRTLFDIASIHGFWRAGYIYVWDILPFWQILFVLILFLVVYGFISRFQDKSGRWQIVAFSIVGIAGFVMAAAPALNQMRPFFESLWEHVPIMRSLRDSHRYVALLCLAYALLGGSGVHELSLILAEQKRKSLNIAVTTALCVAVLLPCAYTPNIFGLYGQIKTTDYPQTWYEVNDYLNQSNQDYYVLFLPWHQYMDYSWLPNDDRDVGDLAEHFFDKPVIAGDNIEITGEYSQSTNPISKYVEFLLSKGNELDNLGELLAPLNVKYVILVDEADYRSYDYLYKQGDLSIALSQPGITLFKNEHTTARSYAVDSVEYISSLDDYLALSRTQDVMSHTYFLSEDSSKQILQPKDQAQSSGPDALVTSESSPVKYLIGGTTRDYTVFTVPQNVSTENWEYNGQRPIVTNLGFMPVFESSPEGGQVVYTRFYRVYLPCYIVSGLTLIGMIFLFFWSKRKQV
jgi:hypothetical protein